MRVFSQIYNCQQKKKKNENRMMCGERGNSEKILSSRWEKQNKTKQKQTGRAPLLGLAKSIY